MQLTSLRPAYLTRRVRQMRFEKSNPNAPWLTESAILLLDGFLKPTDVGWEWGSGRSTAWLGSRVGHLTSIEDDKHWRDIVQERLVEEGLAKKVDYRFLPCELSEMDEPISHPYADAALEIPDQSLDFALVDGNIRLSCMRHIIPKIKVGGLLILDNANRYIPNIHLGRPTTIHEPRVEPRSVEWGRVMETLKSWRWINTTDGIWDTRFWLKTSR